MADRPKIVGVLAKREAVRMTDAVPTPAANGIRIANVARLGGGFLEENLMENAITGRTLPGGKAESAGRFGTVDIEVEAHGLGAAYTNGIIQNTDVVDFDPLMVACGYAQNFEGVAPAVNHAYRIADAPITCTLWLYSYTQLFKLVGCVGNMRITARAGQVPIITFSMTGVLREEPTQIALPAITLTQVRGLPVGSATTSLTTSLGVLDFAAGLRLVSFEYNTNSQIAALAAAGAVDGHDGYDIAAHNPTIGLVVRTLPLASLNPIQAARSASPASLSIEWGSKSAPSYNGLLVALPTWNPQWPAFEDDGGIGTYNIAGRVIYAPGLGDPVLIRTQ